MSDRAKIQETKILSEDKYKLQKVTFNYLKKDGNWQTQDREVYDMGNATTILLYNKEQRTVVLTKQFRLVSFLNGNPSGMLIETPAGKLDEESPEEGIKREVEEETGYKVDAVTKVFEAYSSPGSVTELLHFFTGTYTKSMKVSEGGGLKDENEEIEVLEVPFDEALQMIDRGEIKDAKTIMLLQYGKLHNLL